MAARERREGGAGVDPWQSASPAQGRRRRRRGGEDGGARESKMAGFGEEGRPRPRPCSPRRRPPVPYCSARRSELRARRPCLSAAAMSTAARRTPRAASFTGEAPPLEGRGGGRRARLMAGGAVAGSGLAAAGPEGRSPDSRRPGVGARAAAGGDRHSGVRQGGSRQGTAGWWRRRRGASCLLAPCFVISNFVKCEP